MIPSKIFFFYSFKLFNYYGLDLNKKKALDFKNILKKAYIFIKLRKQMVDLTIINIIKDRISNLIKKLQKKPVKTTFYKFFYLFKLFFEL